MKRSITVVKALVGTLLTVSSGYCLADTSIPSHDQIEAEIKAKLCEAKVLTPWECRSSNKEVVAKYSVEGRNIYQKTKANRLYLNDDNGKYLDIETLLRKHGEMYIMEVAINTDAVKDRRTRVVFRDPETEFYVPRVVLNEIDGFLLGDSSAEGPKYDSCVEMADSITFPFIPFSWSTNRIGCLIATGHWVEDD